MHASATYIMRTDSFFSRCFYSMDETTLNREEEPRPKYSVIDMIRFYGPNMNEKVISGAIQDLRTSKHGFRHAMRIYDEMKRYNVEPNVIHYNTLINACKYPSSPPIEGPNTAIRLVREMQEVHHLRPDNITFASLIGVLAHFKDERIFEIWEHMKRRVKPDVRTYSVMLHACVALNKYDFSLRIESEMRQQSMRFDSVIYSNLIRLCSLVGDHERGMRLFEEMCASGIPLCVEPQVFNSLLRLLGQAGKLDEMMALYRRMKTQFRVQPNEIIFGTMFYACHKAKNYGLSVEIAQEMRAQKIRPNNHILTALFLLCHMKGKADLALQLLHDAKQSGLLLNKYSYNALLKTLLACKDHRIFRVYADMKYDRVKPCKVTIYYMLRACYDLQKLEFADVVVEDMRDNRILPTVVIFKAMIDLCAISHDTEFAMQLFEEMKKRGIQPNAFIFQSLTEVMLASGDKEKLNQVKHEYEKMLAETKSQQPQPQPQPQQQQQRHQQLLLEQPHLDAGGEDDSSGNETELYEMEQFLGLGQPIITTTTTTTTTTTDMPFKHAAPAPPPPPPSSSQSPKQAPNSNKRSIDALYEILGS